MGRPKVYADGRTGVSVRMPADLHERLTAAAVERDLSANWLVCRAVEEFLDHLIPVAELSWTRHREAPASDQEAQP